MTTTLDTATAHGERGSPRFISRAAGVALQDMAHSSNDFRKALVELSSGKNGDPRVSLRRWVQPVAEATDLDVEEVTECLAQQLRHVHEFAVLDGGSLEGSLPAIIQLIESGRVELFST